MVLIRRVKRRPRRFDRRDWAFRPTNFLLQTGLTAAIEKSPSRVPFTGRTCVSGLSWVSNLETNQLQMASRRLCDPLVAGYCEREEFIALADIISSMITRAVYALVLQLTNLKAKERDGLISHKQHVETLEG